MRPALSKLTHKAASTADMGINVKGTTAELAAMRKNPRLRGENWRNKRFVVGKIKKSLTNL